MAFEILRAQEQHLEELSELFAQAHQEYYTQYLPHFFQTVPIEYWHTRLTKALQTPNYHIYIAFDTDHQVCAGFCELYIRNTTVPYIVPKQRLVINNIFIRPHYRRRGLASLLLDRIHQLARQWHISTIELEVASNNIGAQRLYQRFGFTPRTITMEHRVSS